MVRDTYNNLLSQFSDTLEKTSEDTTKTSADKYMTSCQKIVVNVDRLKDDFVKNMSLPETPKSCDALYMTLQNELYMIEFKNGKIDKKKKHEVNRKIFESLLILSEKFSKTTDFMRDNMNFVLVYNENINPEQELDQDEIIGARRISKPLFKRANVREIRFGLERFKTLYFKDVFTYSKTEFDVEFVLKHCV